MDTLFNTKRVSINGYDYTILLHSQDTAHSHDGNNQNVSCALIALCNVLLLSPGLSHMAKNLITLTQNRQQVSKQDIVQVLSYIGVQQNDTIDINQLLQTLPNLCNHDNDNPQQQSVQNLPVDPEFNGSFEDGMAMSIFRLYNVGLVHGWLISPETDPVAYEHVSRYSYENAQRVLVQSYDIKKGDLQVANSDSILEDANYLKSFLARSATQLTEYGLSHLKEIMVEKSFAVLYRNDEFFTLHKNNGGLYVLVVDNNYQDTNDIVWKSLKSISGNQDALYTGTFIQASVGRTLTHATSYSIPVEATVTNPFQDSNTNANDTNNNIISDNNHIEGQTADREQQLEDDELLARRLQEQEDQEYADAVRNTYVGGRQRRRTNQRGRRSQYGADEPEMEPQGKDKKKKRTKLKNKLFSKKDKSKKSGGKKDSDCVVM